MKASLLKQGDVLIATLQAALSDAEMTELQDTVAESVGRYRSRGLLVDVTPLDVMDSFGVRTLRTIAQIARLRGAKTVIVGIQPDVAFSMVRMGLTLEGVETALDLEEGLAWLAAQTKAGLKKPSGPSRSGPTRTS